MYLAGGFCVMPSKHRLDRIGIVGCRLIDKIVQPVLIEQVGMARQARVFIAQTFFLERPGVVLRVPGDEDLPSALARERVDAHLW